MTTPSASTRPPEHAERYNALRTVSKIIRILAYVVPAAGHLFPFVPGLQELQRRGHHVHVRTGEKLLATARAAGTLARKEARSRRILSRARWSRALIVPTSVSHTIAISARLIS